jgi:selenide, water dikinase
MGGEPFMAIAILGWPINKIEPEVARAVLDGSRKICAQAGIPLAGGHSIDCPEPVFGLAVTGKVKKENLKRNDTARSSSLLYLTKPLGIGIITTAQKKGIVNAKHLNHAIEAMLTLNSFGAVVGKLPYVSAMTDVTGFGLLGHLCEICEGSRLSAEIDFAKVPRFEFLPEYIQQKSMPGGTTRNWESYGHKVSNIADDVKAILADPQTSGGLLVVVDEAHGVEFETVALKQGLTLKPFGRLLSNREKTITVI